MIYQQIPRFDDQYVVRKDNDPDREKAQVKALKRQIKREAKGVARELRLDAAFLAEEREKEHRDAAATKEKKRKEIWSWLEVFVCM